MGGSAVSSFVAEEGEGKVGASSVGQNRVYFEMRDPSRILVLRLCFALGLWVGFCASKPLSNDIQRGPPEGFLPQLSEEGILEEGDPDSWMERVLGTMKEGFLRKLNLSDVPQERGKIYPPQFMMELYNKYASDSAAIPQSDVIRSFTVQEITLSVTNGTKSRYRLQFNVSIPSHEKITTAELQFFFSPDAGSKVTSATFKATVNVYEVVDGDSAPTVQLLVGKEVTGSQSRWEMFDVTAAVQSWVQSERKASVFDVVVDGKECEAADAGTRGVGCSNMSLTVGDNTSAALIVFSDDLGSKRRETKKELREMIVHEEESMLQAATDWNRVGQLSNSIDVQHPRRRRRKAEREYCRRTSLKVNFKEIGWDSWIVAPPEYDAFECRGFCYHPLTDESTPSKHALIQTLINMRDPKKANMACCVPIKLDPITIMYQENGRLTIRYLYEEMKVAECGCR